MTSEEAKAVNEALAQEFHAAMAKAFQETCHYGGNCLPPFADPISCPICGWDRDAARSKIEQLSESS